MLGDRRTKLVRGPRPVDRGWQPHKSVQMQQSQVFVTSWQVFVSWVFFINCLHFLFEICASKSAAMNLILTAMM